MKKNLVIVIIITFLISFFVFQKGKAEIISLSGTDVGGIISTDTNWGQAGSPYNLTEDVQVDTSVTLTIEPGVIINGNGYKMQFWGTLSAVGTPDNYIHFNQTHIATGGGLIEIRYAFISDGGIFQNISQGGSLILTDSHIRGIQESIEIWYPVSDCFIERNTFYIPNNHFFSIWTALRGGIDLYVRNNSFMVMGGDNNVGLIDVWYVLDGSETIVKYNSFLNTNQVAVSVSYDGVMTATSNYWGTNDIDLVESMILDRNDDLNRPSYIDYVPILTEPHPDTPELIFSNIYLPLIQK